ncbi:MAG: carboxymuconolactone decarboxylase family protein [Rhizobiales bacterium]|nr:carboxymuconolactone decarboxylase family protein [Hyphomicrobiales bacterium]
MADPKSSISRLGGVAEPSNDAILADMFARIRAKRGRLLNIHQVVGHAPKMLRAQAAYATALREESSLPRDLQELLILRIAQVNASAYEQSVHRPIAIACGVPPAKLAALAVWQSSPLFDTRERAALGFIEQAAQNGEVDDDIFTAAENIFCPQEIVELTALVAWYVGNSRFVRALRIADEAKSNEPV